MREFIKSPEGAELIAETLISIVFGLIIALLGWWKVLTGQEMVFALVIWALITPSPSHWVITIGNYLRAQKNGSS